MYRICILNLYMPLKLVVDIYKLYSPIPKFDL